MSVPTSVPAPAKRESADGPDPAPRSASRRSLALRGALFELGGFGASQALRLASNVLLARLLAPEAFGMASLVFVFLQGLELLSDVGINQAITRSERGDDESFLNTAWTLQIARGLALFLIAVVLAKPVALLYETPALTPLLLVAATQALLAGFNSTSLHSFRRRLLNARLVGIDLSGQLLNVAVMLGWASFDPSVWALIAGGFANTLTRLAASHLARVGYRNRIHFDPTAARALLEFGRWVFGSSAIFFVGRQGDRLLIGHFLGLSMLGVYSIAVTLSEAVGAVIDRISHNVFFPILSQMQHQGRDEFRRVYYRMRLHLDALAQPALGALAVLGSLVVELLWDARYAQAGWMLEALCVRVAMSCFLTPCDRGLLALGQAPVTLYRALARASWIVIGIPVGFAIAGLPGLVWATALAELPVLLILWPAFRRAGMLSISRELLAPAFFLFGALLASGIEPWLVAWIR